MTAAVPDPARAPGTAPVRAAFSRLGHAIGRLVGGQDYHDRLRTATFAREALERSEELKRDWNRQVDRAAEEGVHVIYTDGYDRLHKELDTIAGDMLLDRGVKSEISAVLAQLGKAMSNRNYFDNWPKLMAGQMGSREALAAKAAERGVAVPDLETLRHMAERDRLCGGPLRRTHGRPGELRHPPGLHRAPRKRASAQRSRGCATCLKTTTGT